MGRSPIVPSKPARLHAVLMGIVVSTYLITAAWLLIAGQYTLTVILLGMLLVAVWSCLDWLDRHEDNSPRIWRLPDGDDTSGDKTSGGDNNNATNNTNYHANHHANHHSPH